MNEQAEPSDDATAVTDGAVPMKTEAKAPPTESPRLILWVALISVLGLVITASTQAWFAYSTSESSSKRENERAAAEQEAQLTRDREARYSGPAQEFFKAVNLFQLRPGRESQRLVVETGSELLVVTNAGEAQCVQANLAVVGQYDPAPGAPHFVRNELIDEYELSLTADANGQPPCR